MTHWLALTAAYLAGLSTLPVAIVALAVYAVLRDDAEADTPRIARRGGRWIAFIAGAALGGVCSVGVALILLLHLS